jgi:DNA-binding NarL/FixJ family response regulator
MTSRRRVVEGGVVVSQRRVVFVDRHDLLTDCLGLVLEKHGFRCFKVLLAQETAGRPDHLRSNLLALRPDIALINADLGMGLDAVTLVESASSVGVPVVVLHDSADDMHWGSFLMAGAQIVVPKTAPLASVVSIVQRLCDGEGVLGPTERERLTTLRDQHASEVFEAQHRVGRLSAQEGSILRALMVGLTVSQIAAERVVSVATVRTQVKAVLAKLEVRSQLSAVAVAHRAGWNAQPMSQLPTVTPPGAASAAAPS